MIKLSLSAKPHSLFWCLTRTYVGVERGFVVISSLVPVCLCVCVQSVFLDLKGKFESGEIDVSDSEEEGEGEGEAGGELDSAASDEDDGNVFRREKCNACMHVCMYVHVQTCTRSAQANSSKGGAHCEWNDITARQN